MLLLLLAKLLLESESWDTVQKFPTARKSPSLPYPSGQLHQLEAYVTLDLVVLRYTHNECSSDMTSGLLTYTVVKSTGGRAGRNTNDSY